MAVPISNVKKLDNWTHADLVRWAAWAVVSGITSGGKLESSMHVVVDAVLQWGRVQETKRRREEGKKATKA